MIVIDTNVLIYLFFPSQFSDAAEALVRSDPDWHAPELWRSEFSHFISGEIRRQKIDLARGLAKHAEAERRIQTTHLHDPAGVLRLVRHCHCSAYDLEFVALAQRLGTKLTTMDRQILAEFPVLARPLVPA